MAKFEFQLASDLHSEFFAVEDFGSGASYEDMLRAQALRDALLKRLVQPTAPFLALVGDIGSPFGEEDQLRTILCSASRHYTHTFLVLGNHEFYNEGRSILYDDDYDYLAPCLHHYADVRARMLELIADLPNVTLMDRHTGPRFVKVPDGTVSTTPPRTPAEASSTVRVVGCTLWTHVPRHARQAVTSYLMDYRLILPPPPDQRDANGAYKPKAATTQTQTKPVKGSAASSSSSSSTFFSPGAHALAAAINEDDDEEDGVAGSAASSGHEFKRPRLTFASPAAIGDAGASGAGSAAASDAGIAPQQLFGSPGPAPVMGGASSSAADEVTMAESSADSEDKAARARLKEAKARATSRNLNPSLFHEGRDARKAATYRFLSAEHDADLEYLTAQLKESCASGDRGSKEGACVFLTHHAPTFKGTSNPRYTTPLHNLPNHGFASSLEYLFRDFRVEGNSNLAAWCYGHTHYNMDEVIDGTRVVSNQRGYMRGVEGLRTDAKAVFKGSDGSSDSASAIIEGNEKLVKRIELEAMKQGEPTGLPYDRSKVVDITVALLSPPLPASSAAAGGPASKGTSGGTDCELM